MSDYDRIASAIDYIRNNIAQQPSLEEIAAHVHLSPFHFQRLFSQWAGVTPKRFLQTLTLEKAKTLLKNRDISVLEASHDTGLSSSSRLYDHFVQIDAVTPSEYKQAGLGLIIEYGVHPTLYGETFIAVTERGICRLMFFNGETKQELLSILQQEWPEASLVENQQKTAVVLSKLFEHQGTADQPLSLLVRGTNFQIKVWKALLNIPPGQLVAYGDIANAIGKPKASRAVGTAIGANPVALIIPCHRVIQQGGQLGGYRWGVTRKHAMLARETASYE